MRELPHGDPWRTQDEWETKEEACVGLNNKERRQHWWECRWVQYPTYCMGRTTWPTLGSSKQSGTSGAQNARCEPHDVNAM